MKKNINKKDKIKKIILTTVRVISYILSGLFIITLILSSCSSVKGASAYDDTSTNVDFYESDSNIYNFELNKDLLKYLPDVHSIERLMNHYDVDDYSYLNCTYNVNDSNVIERNGNLYFLQSVVLTKLPSSDKLNLSLVVNDFEEEFYISLCSYNLIHTNVVNNWYIDFRIDNNFSYPLSFDYVIDDFCNGSYTFTDYVSSSVTNPIGVYFLRYYCTNYSFKGGNAHLKGIYGWANLFNRYYGLNRYGYSDFFFEYAIEAGEFEDYFLIGKVEYDHKFYNSIKFVLKSAKGMSVVTPNEVTAVGGLGFIVNVDYVFYIDEVYLSNNVVNSNYDVLMFKANIFTSNDIYTSTDFAWKCNYNSYINANYVFKLWSISPYVLDDSNGEYQTSLSLINDTLFDVYNFDYGNDVSNSVLIDSFTLINLSLGGVLSLLNYAILPGVSIGVLISIPLVFGLIMFVIKLLR